MYTETAITEYKAQRLVCSNWQDLTVTECLTVLYVVCKQEVGLCVEKVFCTQMFGRVGLMSWWM